MIHPCHTDSLRRTGLIIGLLAIILGLVWAMPAPSAFKGIAGYVPLHTLLETGAIVVATLVFAIGWNAYCRERPGNITLLACLFLGVALLDLSHMLSFKGMPDFVTASDPEKAINFWLAARGLATAALLIAAATPWRPFADTRTRYFLLGLTLALVLLANWLFLFRADLLPRTFVEGQGLTRFKITAEYLIIAVNLTAAGALWWRMRRPLPFNAPALFGAVCAMALSELCFTLYANVADVFNLLGHIYKAVSYFFLYRAIFVETIEAPFRQLDAAQRQLQATQEAIPDLLWLKNADGVYLDCNAAFQRYFGAAKEKIIGKTDYDFVDREIADAFRENDRKATLANRPSSNEEWLTFAGDNKLCLVETIKTPLRDASGSLIGVLGIARDITERKRLEGELQEMNRTLENRVRQRTEALAETNAQLNEALGKVQLANDELVQSVSERKQAEVALATLNATLERRVEQRTVELAAARDAAETANRAKSQFLANMSHELRTPLNSLLILAQLLAENASENLTAKQAEYALTIHGAGSDLLEMINDLLDLAKIEAGHMPVVSNEMHFAALREAVMRSLGPLAQVKGLAFEIEQAADLPAAMHTDAVRLLQALRNLIGNAVKFTSAGRVGLRVAPAASGWNAQHPILSQASAVIAFSVSDTGIGIAADKQQLIFESFQQADSGTARSYGGTGLGLSISRQIAHLLGGELTLCSAPGVGSAFTLYLPLGAAAAAELASPAPLTVASPSLNGRPHETDLALAGRKVLLVDDDIRNVYATSALLERHELVVISALSGSEALELLPQHPDTAAVLMDIMMPEMDGYETTRRLRAMDGYAALPVIALTARAMEGDREKCHAAGCSDYLSKPVDTEQLQAMLRDWISPQSHSRWPLPGNEDWAARLPTV